MIVDNYLVDALHTFQVGTLNQLGYRPRVTLVNYSHQRPEYATDYIVDLTVVFADQSSERFAKVMTLKQKQRSSLDCAQFLKKKNQEAILTFHLIPEKYYGQKFAATNKAETWFLLTAQDHYVEYVNDHQFSAGVLYQSGAFNYSKFSSEFTTMIQAPKIYLSKNIKTYMNVIYNRFDDGAGKPAQLKCALIKNDQIVSRWVESIAAKGACLIDVSKHIGKSLASVSDENPEFYCFYGLCEAAALLPLTVTVNAEKHTLGVEHSLPPNYYGSTMTGPNRKKAILNLSNSLVFAGMGS